MLGNVPVIAALYFPRQLLSESFHSPEVLMKIRTEEHEEKVSARAKLVEILSSTLTGYSVDSYSKKGPYHLSTLPDSTHLSLLCACNAMFPSTSLYKYNLLPSFIMRSSLSKRAKEIQLDDEMLRAGPVRLEDVSTEDLLSASVRRGSSPTLSRDECISYLRKWLNLKSTNRKADSDSDSDSFHSVLAHVLALGLPSKFE